MKSEDYRAENLFSRLFTYRPAEGRMSLEDYCTEALAWCLGPSEDLAQQFLALTGIPFLRGYRGPMVAATQESFKALEDEDEEEEGQASGGRFDLVIRPKDSSDFVLVVESKAFSGFRASQLATYRGQLDSGSRFKDVPKDRRFLVALTNHAVTQQYDQAGGRLRWSRVCRILEQQMEPRLINTDTRAEARTTNICQQLAAFLKEKGMSLELTKANSDIQNHVKGLVFREQIEGLLARIRELDPDLRKALKGTAEFCCDPNVDTTWLGLFNRPGQLSLFLGFRLTMHDQPAYSMQVETEWPNQSRERAIFKGNLEREYPRQVEDAGGWITLRKPMTPDYDGDAEKVIAWLGNTATRMRQLLTRSKANRPRK